MNPTDPFEVDVDFELLMESIRRCKARTSHGRLVITMDIHAGLLVFSDIEPSGETTDDIDHIMRGKPGW